MSNYHKSLLVPFEDCRRLLKPLQLAWLANRVTSLVGLKINRECLSAYLNNHTFIMLLSHTMTSS